VKPYQILRTGFRGQYRGKTNCKFVLTELEKAYIAGFLDGDGCIMFQLVRRKDYVLGYQVRASIVFYQKTKNKEILNWLKGKLQYGYIRDRNDEMTEYTIVGKNYVIEILRELYPYLKLKRNHANVAFKINQKWPKSFNQKNLLAISKLVDRYKELNYSKKRKNTSATIKGFFASGPRND